MSSGYRGTGALRKYVGTSHSNCRSERFPVTAPTTANDVVKLLHSDHQAVEQWLKRFESIEPGERDADFGEVGADLVRHEVAEEVVVYPALRRDIQGGGNQADARIAEQAEAEELLAKMEKLDPGTAEFIESFKKLRSAVLDHAKAEESEVLPLLTAQASEARRAELGERYRAAKEAAPTHPHPHLPDKPPGNLLAGPIAAIFDKTRDAAPKVA